jgi:hypothetical protein
MTMFKRSLTVKLCRHGDQVQILARQRISLTLCGGIVLGLFALWVAGPVFALAPAMI